MKEFTEKELKRIRDYFNKVDAFDQSVGEVKVEDCPTDCCLFCHLAISLDWKSGGWYNYDTSFDPRIRNDKKDFFLNRLYNHLEKKLGSDDKLVGNLDSDDRGIEDIYFDLICDSEGKLGDLLVDKILI